MLDKLKGGEKVIFLDNLLKNGKFGNKIERIDQMYLEIHNKKGSKRMMFCDDPKLPIFKELRNLIYNENVPIQTSTKYYTYCLIDGKYKLLTFGYQINNKISLMDTKDKLFYSKTKSRHGFLDYDDSYFEDGNINTLMYSNGFDSIEKLLKSKTLYIEDVRNSLMWTNKNKYDLLIEFFKENNIKSDIIREITQKQRELKLNRILKEDKVKITVDTVLEIKNILDKTGITNDEINEIYKNIKQ